jgi:hypothetical protein
MKVFRERTFLIRSLIGIFLVQFAYVGYQAYGCRSTVLNATERSQENIATICSEASRNFLETGKLAIPTILALLIKSPPSDSELESSEKSPIKKATRVRKRKEPEVIPPPGF